MIEILWNKLCYFCFYFLTSHNSLTWLKRSIYIIYKVSEYWSINEPTWIFLPENWQKGRTKLQFLHQQFLSLWVFCNITKDFRCQLKEMKKNVNDNKGAFLWYTNDPTSTTCTTKKIFCPFLSSKSGTYRILQMPCFQRKAKVVLVVLVGLFSHILFKIQSKLSSYDCHLFTIPFAKNAVLVGF